MDNFTLLLKFMILPISVTLLFGLTLPIIGRTLTVRKELLFTISLPVVTGAVLAYLAIRGVAPENLFQRIVRSTLILWILYSVIQKVIKSNAHRQLLFAGVLVGSEALTRLLVAWKPEIKRQFVELLNGEMLAIMKPELILVASFTVLFLILLILFFPLVRNYTLDEESLKRYPKLLLTITVGTQLFVILFVVLGVMTVGPLVTLALLILPTLFSDNGRNGFTSSLVLSSLIGVLSISIAFPLALKYNLPPAYCIPIGVIAIGLPIWGVRKLV